MIISDRRVSDARLEKSSSTSLLRRTASDPATAVELVFTFISAATSLPVSLPRTTMTFFDFDNGFASNLRECMQVNYDHYAKGAGHGEDHNHAHDDSLVTVELGDNTELFTYPNSSPPSPD